MKPTSLFLVAGCALAFASRLHAQTSFVQESESEFCATGRDGAAFRVFSVDKTTGQVTNGLVESDGAITWELPRATGIAEVTGAALWRASGPATTDQLALTAPFHNRIEIPGLGAQEPYGFDLTAAVGPFSLAGYWNSSTTGPTFVVASVHNGEPAIRLRRQAPSGPALTEAQDLIAGSAPRAANRAAITSSIGGVGFIYDGKLQLGSIAPSGTFEEDPQLHFPVESPLSRWTHGSFTMPGAAADFFDFVPGSTAFRLHSISVLSNGSLGFPDTPASFDLGNGIAQISVMELPTGGSRLIVVFADGTAALYDFDGIHPPVLKAAYLGSDYQFGIPAGNGRLALLSRNGTARDWEVYDGTGASPSTVPLASGSLPDLLPAGAPLQNVFLLQGEPFADPATRLFGGRQQAEWTGTPDFSQGQPRPLAAGVTVRGERLVSEAGGLQPTGDSQSYSDGSPQRFLLPNQHTAQSSLISFKTSAQNQRPLITFSPPGGDYPLLRPSPTQGGAPGSPAPSAPAVAVRLTSSAGGDIHYRTSETGNWQLYTGPIEIHETTRLEARAPATAIQQATYRVAAPPSVAVPEPIDANHNGLSDAWEETFGISDPNGDADGDGVNNLTEHNAGTDPLDPNSFPGPDPLAQIRLSAALAPEGGFLLLSWPEGLGDVILESSPDLIEWTPVQPQPEGNSYRAAIQDQRAFFRLRSP